jgi:hypothetical protein
MDLRNKDEFLIKIDPLEHYKFEVGWIYEAVSIDRVTGEVILRIPILERLERIVTGSKPE